MRIFHKLFLLLVGVSAVPMALGGTLILWQSAALQRQLITRISDNGVRTTRVGQGALYEQARKSHLQLVQDRAAQLEAAFEAVRRAVILERTLAESALADEPPPPNAPRLYEGNEVASLLKDPQSDFARRIYAREPYAMYHLAPGTSLDKAKGDMEKLRRLGAYFAYNQKVIPWCRSTFLGHKSGLLLGYPGGSGFAPDFDHRTRYWYVKALENAHLVWTKLYLDRNGKDLTITYADPVRDKRGEIVAVAAMDVKVTAVLDQLFDLGPVPVTDAVLLDERGRVRISASYKGNAKLNLGGLTAEMPPAVSEFLGGRFTAPYREISRHPERTTGIVVPGEDEASPPDLAGGGSIFSYARISLKTSEDEAKSWYYIVQTPIEPIVRPAGEIGAAFGRLYEELSGSIDKEVRRLWLEIAAMTLAVFFLALGLAYATARAATTPLVEIDQAVQRIAHGDFDQKVAVTSQDEIGEVAESINEMTRGLKEGVFVKQSFKRYVAASVVEQLIEHPDRLKLGGERRELTVFFSDIHGFTTLSEQLSPEKLVELINEYLGAMTDAIFRHEGTLDKYEGDAIMAFWGAPVEQKDHALRACRAALDNLEALHGLWDRWEARGIPRLDIRIGLNTGPMVVGNMGSLVKMDYTVMGDAVNLGSRLEGASKAYGTHILLSEATRRAAGEAIEVREVDLLAVKGKTRAVRVYELLGLPGRVPGRRLEGCRAFEAGLAAYRGTDWDLAEAEFRRADELLGGDPPARAFLERVSRLRGKPPARDWDGTFALMEK